MTHVAVQMSPIATVNRRIENMTLTMIGTAVKKGALNALKRVGAATAAAGGTRTGSRQSAGIAPHPAAHTDAIVQVYGARASSWRGWLAIHTWIAVKPTDAREYTVYEVDGWRQSKGLPVVRIEKDLPDRYWNGKRPRLIKEVRGDGVDALIAAVDRAARSYPWPETYRIFPGPNCNSFTAWIAAEVPELALALPFSAIGSGYGAIDTYVDQRQLRAEQIDLQ